jgi:hypothetical protein
VLDTGAQSYAYWIRTNNLNGYVYASFAGGDNPSVWTAGIWLSTDSGATWRVYRSFPIHNPYFGSISASNFQDGTLYYCLQLDSGWQNGVEIYPDYTMQAALDFNAVLGAAGLAGVYLTSTVVAAYTAAVILKKVQMHRRTWAVAG